MNINLKKPFAVLAIGASLAVGLVGCGDDADTASTNAPSTEAPSTEMPAETPSITIDGAWARTSPSMVTMGAAYMTISTTADDELVGVSVDSSIAGEAQIHEMVMASEASMPMGSDTTMAMGSDTTMAMGSDTTMAMGSGEMVMQQIMKLAVPASGGVELKPGGYHIMLIDLVKPLELGQTFDVTLTFAKAGDIVVPVTVADEAP